MMRVRKKVLAAGAALLVAAAAGVSAAVWMTSDRLADALNPASYDRVQVTLAQKWEPVQGADEEDGEAPRDETGEPAEPVTVAVMTKDGDRIYEEGQGGRYYFYKREEKDYVLVYDTMSGILEEGRWVETPAEQFSLRPAFSFDRLSSLPKGGFKKEAGQYRPDTAELPDAFFGLLGIREQNMGKYAEYAVSFQVRRGRLASITAVYIYDKTYQVEETYTFAYADTPVNVPEPTPQ